MNRLALATVGATFVLIFAGGLVTNTGAGLAVPDWPTTFGHNMFLFPWSGMVGGIFYEHSHRLIGSVVGLLTLALAVGVWRRGPVLRALGALAVVIVIVQGILGGLRVVLVDDVLAIVHGSTAQAFFGLLVAVAVLTYQDREPMSLERPTGTALAVAALVYVQVVFGALLTHAGWIGLHLSGAVAVYAVVTPIAVRMRRSGDRLIAGAARALLTLLAVQLVLGAGSFLARFSSLALPGGQTTVLALPVVHRLVASLILGAAVALVVRTATAAAPRACRLDVRAAGGAT